MSSKKKRKGSTPAQTALCYVRQSFTRDENDKDSPERQKANIIAHCEKMGWTPEFYEDAEKHKTGTKEANRPGWLALKARLGDSDVVALIANDLARLHRKGWRVGDLIDYLDEHDVTLVLTAPGREVDLSTPLGRLFVQFTAILDEWYAADISQRAKDHIAHRKAQGMSIGMPPFGAIRGEDGYLKKSPDGAWLLQNGTFVAGTPHQPPESAVAFKSYHEAAEYVLTLYSTGAYGVETISYAMNNEGWTFRDRTGNPRPFERDDIRRIVANWAEYGGITIEGKAKDRAGYEQQNVDELPFREDRAIFRISLLKEVAKVRQERTRKPADHGRNKTVRFYPLTGITYCYHCEQVAQAKNSYKFRSLLSGQFGNGVLRYRHKPGVKCGITNRSVPCEEYEVDFRRLISLFTIRPEAYQLMLEIAIQADKARGEQQSAEDLAKQKQEAIAICYRRIDAAVNLYKDGEIDRNEYLRVRALNEREIAHWQSRTTETEQLGIELAMCIEAVERIVRLWDASNDEDRQGLARSLFTSIVYNLDTRRIVSFKLKPWAERFLVLRAALYANEYARAGETNKPQPEGQGLCTELPHTEFESVFCP